MGILFSKIMEMVTGVSEQDKAISLFSIGELERIVDETQEGSEKQLLFLIGEIERMVYERLEGIEKQQEIDEILGGELTDDDDLLEELEAIVAESLPSPVEIETEPEKDLELPEVPPDEIPERRKKIKTENKELVAAT